MDENYINIFTTFIAGLLENKKISLPDAVGLVKVFEPASNYIKSGKQLVIFLDEYLEVFPQLEELKNKLLQES